MHPSYVKKHHHVGIEHICEPAGTGERYDLAMTIDALFSVDGSCRVSGEPHW